MTKHFNGLSEAEAERLALLVEECGEVIQECGKILRHGFDSYNSFDPEKITNRRNLEKELGDITLILEMMLVNKDVSNQRIQDFKILKKSKINNFLHHNKIPVLGGIE